MSHLSQNPRYNVTFIGDPFVGKTMIVNSFLGNSFTDKYDMTVGAAMIKIEQKDESNSEPTCLYVWDTGGEEKFKSLAPVYYRNSNCAVIVYDVTKSESFENVSKWYDLYKDKTGNAPNNKVIIIGNKIDLRQDKQKNDEFVDSERGKQMASKYDCEFIETSAKTGENISLLLNTLVQYVKSNNQPSFFPPLQNAEKKDSGCC